MAIHSGFKGSSDIILLLCFKTTSMVPGLPQCQWICLNSLRATQNGIHFPDDTFKCIFLKENLWILIEIPLKFIPKGPINNTRGVQGMWWRFVVWRYLSVCTGNNYSSACRSMLYVKCWSHGYLIPVTQSDKYSLLMHFYWMSNMFLWVEIFLFFVCYHVVSKRHSQLDYELNGL